MSIQTVFCHSIAAITLWKSKSLYESQMDILSCEDFIVNVDSHKFQNAFMIWFQLFNWRNCCKMAFSSKKEMCAFAQSQCDMSQSADDPPCCKALARKHHQNVLLLIMGLVETLNKNRVWGQPDNNNLAEFMYNTKWYMFLYYAITSS